MAVVFRCPQGHRLSCPEERAGKIGKCPKCGSTFVVPSAEVAATISAANLSGVGIAVADSAALPATPATGTPAGAAPAGAAPAAPVAATPGASENATPALGPPGDVIVFLCPNGHKLNCPPSLQGKAGKCPHCGARFVIPAHEEDYLSEDEALEEDELDEVDERQDSEYDDDHHEDMLDDPEAAAPGESDLPADFLERLTGSAVQAAPAAPAPAESPPAPAPLVDAFEELWQYRARGLVVQLHLRSGTVLAPDRYSFRSSTDRYAIFAFKDADGLFCVSAVAWDEVERISVQGMKFLPDELFQ